MRIAWLVVCAASFLGCDARDAGSSTPPRAGDELRGEGPRILRDAEIVLSGRFVERAAVWSEDRKIITTTLRVAVEEALRGGAAPQAIVLHQAGGEIGGTVARVSGFDALDGRPFDRAVFFLTERAGEVYARAFVRERDGRLDGALLAGRFVRREHEGRVLLECAFPGVRVHDGGSREGALLLLGLASGRGRPDAANQTFDGYRALLAAASAPPALHSVDTESPSR